MIRGATHKTVRRGTTALVSLIAATSLAGCTQPERKIEVVQTAVATTRRHAAEFAYTDARDDRVVTVAGVVEDDFRFKALVSINGSPAYEEIAYDDALALRFHDTALLPELIDRTRIDTADISTELKGVTAVQALQTRRWVIDDDGAPPVTAFGTAANEIGTDPVFDALTALRYVEKSLSEAFSVEEWREEDLNPTYSRTEDFFPKPEEGSGVTRYDLARLFLPAAGEAAGSGGQRSLASTKNFRKMAIYVKDGRIIRVLERIEVVGKFTADVEEYTRALLKETRAPESLSQEFEAITRGADDETLGRRLLDFLNKLLIGLGVPPVPARTMSFEFKPSTGAPASVTLPTEDVVKGSLEVMISSRQPAIATDPNSPGADASETTTTTIVVDGAPVDGEAPGEEEEAPVPEEPTDGSTTSLPIIPG